MAPRLLGRLIPGVGIALTAYELYQWWTDEPGGPDLSNYTKVCGPIACSPVGNPINACLPICGDTWWSNFGKPGCTSTSGACPTIGDVVPGDYADVFKLQYRGFNGTTGAHVYQTVERWTLTGSGPSPTFSYVVGRAPFYEPGVGTPLPSLFPEDLPIMQPAPTPQRPPLLPAPPGTQPSEQPEVETRPNRRTRPRTVPNVPTLPVPAVIMPPVVYPPVGPPVVMQPDPVVVQPNPDGTMEPPPPLPPDVGGNSPPKQGVKERKLNIRSVAGKAWVVIGAVTESLDFFYVLWRAIPEHLRSDRHAGIYEHMADLYKYWDEIPLAEAVEGYINNQIEDYYFGQFGRASGRASRNLNITTGLNRVTKQAGEIAQDIDRKGKQDDFNPVPQLSYDEKNGWGLDWDLLPGGFIGD